MATPTGTNNHGRGIFTKTIQPVNPPWPIVWTIVGITLNGCIFAIGEVC